MTALSALDRLARARAAQTEWVSAPVSQRIEVLTRMRKQIALDRDQLIDAVVSDTGKPPLDALGGDVLVTLEQMRFYERRAAGFLKRRRVGRSLLLDAGCSYSECAEPHGVVLVFGPANYPLQLCLVPAITALYAGNAVILKVSERTPKTARAIEQVVSRAGLPKELLQVVCDVPTIAAELIDAHPDFIFFTGSRANGLNVASRAALLGIPVLLELGGNDAAVVFSDCDFERTVAGVVYGAFCNAGQVCVGIRRAVVQKSIMPEFLAGLVHQAGNLRVSAGAEFDLGVPSSGGMQNLVDQQVREALELGARLETPTPYVSGRPVILSEVPSHAHLLNEEVFGPVLCVQSFETEQEAITLANASPYALGASLWTRDFRRGRRVAGALKAANCSVNDVIRNIANPHAAFGGNAASGYGRYHGIHGLRAFSRVKTVMENRSRKQTERNWFPLTREKYRGLDLLIELRHLPSGITRALRRFLHLASVAVFLGASAAGAQGAHLLLQVRLPEQARGRVAYLVFNGPRGFPQDRAQAIVHGFSDPVDRQGMQTIDAGNLPPGQFAVSVYLDENGNGKLDAGLFGIPREPVGASNNPRRRMGPPRFEDCVFTMNTATQTLQITLVRP